MDAQTVGMLRDLTQCATRLDDRLVNIYWTYAQRRLSLNRNAGLTVDEWRYLCYRLGVLKSPATMNDAVRSYVEELVQQPKLDAETTASVVDALLLTKALASAEPHGSAIHIRLIDYERALAGKVAPPDHIVRMLAALEERFLDIERAEAERHQPEPEVVDLDLNNGFVGRSGTLTWRNQEYRGRFTNRGPRGYVFSADGGRTIVVKDPKFEEDE
jgi:hypothetical protein